MDVLILLVFVSLMLALSAVGLFAWLVRERTFDHADRLALLVIEDESPSRHRTKQESE
jgi:cbb3-type cytochrome oxidase maturation protein